MEKSIKLNNQITVCRLEQRRLTLANSLGTEEINFDFFLEQNDVNIYAKALLNDNLVHSTIFLLSYSLFTRLPEVKKGEYRAGVFKEHLVTLESFEFFKELQELGLPNFHAAQTAYLTDVIKEWHGAPEIIPPEAFKVFLEKGFSLKAALSTSSHAGLNNFIAYYFIAVNFNIEFADEVNKAANGDPARMFAVIRSMRGIDPLIVLNRNNKVTREVVHSISVFSESNIFKASGYKNGVFSNLIDLILNIDDWNEVNKNLDNARYRTGNKLANFINETIGGYSQFTINSEGNNSFFYYNSSNELSPSLAAIQLEALINAHFTPELVTEAIKTIENIDELVRPYSFHHFNGLMAYLNYAKSGGSLNDTPDWIAAADPYLELRELVNLGIKENHPF